MRDLHEKSDGVAFTMKPTERFPDTGLALIRFWKGERICDFPGVVLTGAEYQNLKVVGINVVVEHGQFPAFLKRVECEINALFPVKSVLDVLRFEANDTVSKAIIEMAVNDYCAELQI